MNVPDEPLRDLLRKAFDLNIPDSIEDEIPILDLLANRVAELLSDEMETFMSLMYRLDVPEEKIAAALSPSNQEAPNVTLARLIIERQIQRIETKRTFKQAPLEDWLDF